MVFSSLEFIKNFLPVFLVVYYILPDKYKNIFLMTASLVFYGYGVEWNPFYILLIILSIFINYEIGLKLNQNKNKKKRKAWLWAGIAYDFWWLFLFKYAGFFLKNITSLFGLAGISVGIPEVSLVLPVGISFYTFQIVSYLADVYWRKVKAETSIIHLGTYLCMFPQLIAGPIVTYESVQKQLKKRVLSFENFEEGLREFVLGLGCKVLIANRVSGLWYHVNAVGFESISTLLAWLGILAYSLQIYFDFYGYSLMAKGLGRMMGFRFPDNFRHPYTAVSMTDFWRKWHITLGSWFREYVYIPLGGNRCSWIKNIRNLFIVWIFTGLWHGAEWNFVLWGIGIFLVICVEKYGYGKFLEQHRWIGHFYMLLFIPLSWLVFVLTDFSQLKIYLAKLFLFWGPNGEGVFAGDYLKYGKMYAVPLIAGIILSTGLGRKIYEKNKYRMVTVLILTGIFWGSIYCIYQGMNDPFLYFRF